MCDIMNGNVADAWFEAIHGDNCGLAVDQDLKGSDVNVSVDDCVRTGVRSFEGVSQTIYAKPNCRTSF